MRVVHINYDGAGWGGASIAMLRIHEREKSSGNQSLIVCRIRPECPDAIRLPVPLWRRLNVFAIKLLMKFCYGHVYRSGLIRTGMADYVNSLQPDKVVLHWMHIDTIGLDEIPKLRGKIEWWLHDLWPMSGVEPYPKTDWYVRGGPSHECRVSRLSWQKKKAVVEAINDRLTVKCPSRWVCSEAKKSVVFKKSVVEYEPYPLSADFVRMSNNHDKYLRSNDKFVLLFGSLNGLKNPIKGFDRLAAALEQLPDVKKRNMELRIFGDEGDDCVISGVPTHFLGRLDATSLIAQYSTADVFLFPSRLETWGQVKSEALACRCPVIAFDESACPEGIVHGQTGWIAQSVNEFSAGISHFYDKKFDTNQD